MDLSDILRNRTEADIVAATRRTLDLSIEIAAAAAELQALRLQLAEQCGADEVPANAALVGQGPDSQVGAGQRDRRPALPEKMLKVLRSLVKSDVPATLRWHLDEVGGVFPQRDRTGINAVVVRTSVPSLTLSGWVVPESGRSAFSDISIVLIGSRGRVSRAAATRPRPDVAVHFGEQQFVSCGFRFEIPMQELSPGVYTLEFTASREGDGSASARAGRIEIAG